MYCSCAAGMELPSLPHTAVDLVTCPIMHLPLAKQETTLKGKDIFKKVSVPNTVC